MTRSSTLPLVSVIMPAFNSAEFIAEALDSLQVQTLRDIEVIVVDDGSSDATVRIAEAHARSDPRISVRRRQHPSGRPACPRNEGLRIARGEYIAFLDSDDIAMPTRLESTLTVMQRTSANFAFADFVLFDNDTHQIASTARLRSVEFGQRAQSHLEHISDTVFRCCPDFLAFLLAYPIPVINTPTVVFSRSLSARTDGFFNEQLVGGEDTDLFLRLAEHADAIFLDEVQTAVRVHRSSLTATSRERCIEDAIVVRGISLDRLRPQLSRAQIRAARQMIATEWFDLGYARWNRSRLREARAAFRESWDVVPSRRTGLAWIKAFFFREQLTRLLATRSQA